MIEPVNFEPILQDQLEVGYSCYSSNGVVLEESFGTFNFFVGAGAIFVMDFNFKIFIYIFNSRIWDCLREWQFDLLVKDRICAFFVYLVLFRLSRFIVL